MSQSKLCSLSKPAKFPSSRRHLPSSNYQQSQRLSQRKSLARRHSAKRNTKRDWTSDRKSLEKRWQRHKTRKWRSNVAKLCHPSRCARKIDESSRVSWARSPSCSACLGTRVFPSVLLTTLTATRSPMTSLKLSLWAKKPTESVLTLIVQPFPKNWPSLISFLLQKFLSSLSLSSLYYAMLIWCL